MESLEILKILLILDCLNLRIEVRLTNIFYLFEDGSELTRSKSTIFSFFEFTEKYMLDADALESLHIMFDGIDHASDLSVFPFSEYDREFRRGKSCDITRIGHVFSGDDGIFSSDTPHDFFATSIFFELDLHSPSHLLEGFIFDFSIDFDDILFFVFVPRMHEIVRESTIIGHDDQTGSLFIETTDRENSLRKSDDIEYPLFSFFSGEACRHYIAWFMKDIVYEIGIIADDLIIDTDTILLWIDHLSDMRDDTIDGDESFFDVFLSLSARTDSGMGDVFLEFHTVRIMIKTKKQNNYCNVF